MKVEPALIIFARNPALGKGKTRIAADSNPEKALEIYHSLLEHTHDLALLFQGTKHVFYTSFIDQNDLWTPDHFTKNLQTGEDLGDRMNNAFHQVAENHQKILIIGSDCPYLTVEDLDLALLKLDETDLVLGPAEDGGYYLLGLKEPDKNIFRNIDWSTNRVLTQTLAAAESVKKTYTLLRELNDIDTIKDWEEFKSYSKNQPT